MQCFSGAVCVLCLLGASFAAAAEPAADPLTKIGQWDGVTQSAALEGPYEDRRQQEVPFGQYSLYLAPWRAYMDTWPAARLLECPGANFNVPDNVVEATAEVLAAAGVRSARVEVGWGSFLYDDPSNLSPDAARKLKARLQALKRHGIRPLMLLNAHHGAPCPARFYQTKLAADAPQGSRSVVLADVKPIRPGYSGLTGLSTYKAAEAIIVSVDADSGKCELSRPLPKDLKAGQTVGIHTLRYQPFSGAVFADGKPNPAAQETLDGWMIYVAAVCRLTKEALGTDAAADAGFDLEVWNEYTFGSDFLEDKRYYDPPWQYKEAVRYTRHGLTRTGHEIILPMTVDFAADPANRLPGVKVLSGFSNQRPWESGSEMWPGQAGFSRHYYTGLQPKPVDPLRIKKANQACLDAAGRPDREPFVPVLFASLPEYYHFAYQCEFMTRDVQPFPGPWKGHFRFSHPDASQPAEVWMSEFNLDRRPWAEQVMKDAGCAKDDPRLLALVHHVGAKAMLRSVAFHSHKGVRTIDFYGARGGDLDLGVLPEAFFKQVEADGGRLTDKSRSLVGPQLTSLGRLVALMQEGKPLSVARPLSVASLVEHQPRLVFQGDGTAAHPDRFHRDDFACLPFQLDAGRFAVGYYVVTRNLGHTWRPDRDRLDPTRYDMPEQTFDLTLTNVAGKGAKVSLFDPLVGEKLAVASSPFAQRKLRSVDSLLSASEKPATFAERKATFVLAATDTSITLRLPTVDYPRFVLIDEPQPGVLILDPRLETTADGQTRLTFRTNLACAPRVSWGPMPDRDASGSKELANGVEHRTDLPKLDAGAGVQIVVEHRGLTTRWPFWGHDVAGTALQ